MRDTLVGIAGEDDLDAPGLAEGAKADAANEQAPLTKTLYPRGRAPVHPASAPVHRDAHAGSAHHRGEAKEIAGNPAYGAIDDVGRAPALKMEHMNLALRWGPAGRKSGPHPIPCPIWERQTADRVVRVN
jgi:hypothetical protein